MSDLLIYETEDKRIEVRLEQESIWLTQQQMAGLFDKDVRTISEHVQNIFRTGELERGGTVRKFRIVRQEGKRQVRRDIDHYNLDMVISVGYRVNSIQGTRFRIWATRRLREYLIKGYVIDHQRLEQNARELEQALELVRKTAASPELNTQSGRGLVEIVSRYTRTFLWLQRYDEGLLEAPGGHAGGHLPTYDEAMSDLQALKQSLMSRGEATELFARPRDEGLAAILGNLDQSAFGEPVYPTIESKAAHLLYFIVKNHPFVDGNKRGAAFLFVDFLHRNGRLLGPDGQPVINDTGLAALTLLVAESDPKQKDMLIHLIMNLLDSREHAHGTI